MSKNQPANEPNRFEQSLRLFERARAVIPGGIYGHVTPALLEPGASPYFAYGAEADAAGVVVGGDALHATSTATSVQVRDGKVLTTDGPFAETKEQLGGFYLFECDDLDQAVEWAAKIPHAVNGTIEIRPIAEFG